MEEKNLHVRIVPMTADHLDEVAELERICFTTPWSRNMLAEELDNYLSAFLVALDDNGKVAGYAGLQAVLDEGYITNVAVRPDCRKQGVAGKLLQVFLDFAQANHLAFLTLEDLVGTVEIIIFPKDYERYAKYLENDAKVFVEGRVTAEEDRNGKLICEKIISFDEVKRELWLQFPSKSDFEEKEGALYGKMMDADGSEHVVIYLAAEKQMKRLPENRNVAITKELLEELGNFLGKDNVKVVEKSL